MKRERNKTRDAPQAAVWITAEQDSGWSELPGGCVRWGFRIAVSGTQTKVLQTPRQESLRELGKKKNLTSGVTMIEFSTLLIIP